MGPAPTILFIDAATRAGWACGQAGSVPESGSLLFAKTKGASRGAVFWGAMRFVADMIGKHGKDIEIFIEAPLAVSLVQGHTNVDTTEVLMGIPAALNGMAYGLGCFSVTTVRVASIRKHFIGANKKGAIAKPLVQQKCLALGWMSKDDDDFSFDRSDALAGWSYAEHQLAPKLCQPIDDIFVRSEARKRQKASA